MVANSIGPVALDPGVDVRARISSTFHHLDQFANSVLWSIRDN